MSDNRFTLPMPRDWLVKMLRSESRKDGFSDHAVRVSLLLDIDAGRVPSQREAARLWGWTRGRVRHQWSEIWEDVAMLASHYGRMPDPERNPMVAKLPPKWQQWLVDKYGTGAKNTPGRNSPRSAHVQPGYEPKKPASEEMKGDSQPSDSPPSAHLQPTTLSTTTTNSSSSGSSARACEGTDVTEEDVDPRRAKYLTATRALLQASEEARRKHALVALRAGNLPHPQVDRALAEAENECIDLPGLPVVRAGPLAVSLALATVKAEAEPQSRWSSRLKLFRSILRYILEEAQRHRTPDPQLPADYEPPNAHPSAPADRQRRRRQRTSSAERAASVTFADVQADRDEARRILAQIRSDGGA